MNLYSIYNCNDQLRFFNTMECDHREKGEVFHMIEVFLKEVLGLLPYEGTNIIPNLSS